MRVLNFVCFFMHSGTEQRFSGKTPEKENSPSKVAEHSPLTEQEHTKPPFPEGASFSLYLSENDVGEWKIINVLPDRILIKCEKKLPDQSVEVRQLFLPPAILREVIKQAELAKQADIMLEGLFRIIDKRPEVSGMVPAETKAIIRSETIQALVEGKPINERLLESIEKRLELERDVRDIRDQWHDKDILTHLEERAKALGHKSEASAMSFALFLKLNEDGVFNAVRLNALERDDRDVELALNDVMDDFDEKFLKGQGKKKTRKGELLQDTLATLVLEVQTRRREDLEMQKEEARRWFEQWSGLVGDDEKMLAGGPAGDEDQIRTWETVIERMEAAAKEAARIQRQLHPYLATAQAEALIRADIGASEIISEEKTEAMPIAPYTELRMQFEANPDQEQALEDVLEAAMEDSERGRAAVALLIDVADHRVLNDRVFAADVAKAVLVHQKRKGPRTETYKELAYKLLEQLVPSYITVEERRVEDHDTLITELRAYNQKKIAIAEKLAKNILQVRLGVGTESLQAEELYADMWQLEREWHLIAAQYGDVSPQELPRSFASYEHFSRLFRKAENPSTLLAALEKVAAASIQQKSQAHSLEATVTARAVLNDIRTGVLKHPSIKKAAREKIAVWNETESLKALSGDFDPRELLAEEHRAA